MKITREEVREEFGRDLYWTRVVFSSDDDSRKTGILTCVSQEYLNDYFKMPWDEKNKKEYLDNWLSAVEKKWLELGEDIFNQDIHYDVYWATPEGEANGIDFLLKL